MQYPADNDPLGIFKLGWEDEKSKFTTFEAESKIHFLVEGKIVERTGRLAIQKYNIVTGKHRLIFRTQWKLFDIAIPKGMLVKKETREPTYVVEIKVVLETGTEIFQIITSFEDREKLYDELQKIEDEFSKISDEEEVTIAAEGNMDALYYSCPNYFGKWWLTWGIVKESKDEEVAVAENDSLAVAENGDDSEDEPAVNDNDGGNINTAENDSLAVAENGDTEPAANDNDSITEIKGNDNDSDSVSINGDSAPANDNDIGTEPRANDNDSDGAPANDNDSGSEPGANDNDSDGADGAPANDNDQAASIVPVIENNASDPPATPSVGVSADRPGSSPLFRSPEAVAEKATVPGKESDEDLDKQLEPKTEEELELLRSKANKADEEKKDAGPGLENAVAVEEKNDAGPGLQVAEAQEATVAEEEKNDVVRHSFAIFIKSLLVLLHFVPLSLEHLAAGLGTIGAIFIRVMQQINEIFGKAPNEQEEESEDEEAQEVSDADESGAEESNEMDDSHDSSLPSLEEAFGNLNIGSL